MSCGTLVMISIDRDELPQCTQKQYVEWVKFSVREIDEINDDNPLKNIPFTAAVREI